MNENPFADPDHPIDYGVTGRSLRPTLFQKLRNYWPKVKNNVLGGAVLNVYLTSCLMPCLQQDRQVSHNSPVLTVKQDRYLQSGLQPHDQQVLEVKKDIYDEVLYEN